jgi:hypothetical protein
MIKKSEDDYRNAVAQSIIDAREYLRLHRDELVDHTATLETIQTMIDDILTRLDDVETQAGHCANALMNYNDWGGGGCTSANYKWIFVLGLDRGMWGRTETNGVGWSAWYDLGGWWKSAPFCYNVSGTDICYVWCIGSDDTLYYNHVTGAGAWAGWAKWTGVTCDLGQGTLD